MTNKTTKIPLPPRGYREVIAQKAGCSTKTVTIALRTNTESYKCDKVREIYKQMYVNPFLKQQKQNTVEN